MMGLKHQSDKGHDDVITFFHSPGWLKTSQTPGAATIVLAFTTFVMCLWGIWHAPAWSLTSPKRLVCILDEVILQVVTPGIAS